MPHRRLRQKGYNVYQLRIYTLRSAEMLSVYATEHWPRHISSLKLFDVTVHGIWTDHDANRHRLFALISFPEAANPATVTGSYMDSAQFHADMQGFDIANIIDVEETLLDPSASSPLQ